jgi:hypothetical protein
MFRTIVENIQALLRKTLHLLRAMRLLLQRHRNRSITARLDEIYSTESSELDPALYSAQLNLWNRKIGRSPNERCRRLGGFR